MSQWHAQVLEDILAHHETGDWGEFVEYGWEAWAWDLWRDRDEMYPGIGQVTFLAFRAATRRAVRFVERLRAQR